MKTPVRDIIIAFIIGILVGGFAVERYVESRFPMPMHGKRGQLIEKFAGELSLTPEQKEKVRIILESTREKFESLHKESYPRFEQIQASSKVEIAQILTPDQLVRFEKMEKRWQERRKKGRFGPPGGF